VQASATGTISSSRLAEQLFTLLRKVTLDPEGDHLRAIEAHDLTVSQVRSLIVLACADPTPLPGGQIADRLGISPAAISRALDGLVRQGLVERCEPGEDRRVRPLAITAAGREVAEEVAALKRAQLEHFADSLDDHQRELMQAAMDSLDLDRGEDRP
jgi:DNA-binding MarR family transcriptional regulator